MSREENSEVLETLFGEAGIEGFGPVTPEAVTPVEELLPGAEIVEDPVVTTARNAREKLSETIEDIEPTTELAGTIVDAIKEEIAAEGIAEELPQAKILPEEIPEAEIITEEAAPPVIPEAAIEPSLPEAALPVTPEAIIPEIAEAEETPPTGVAPFELIIEDKVAVLDDPNRQVLEAIRAEVQSGEAGRRVVTETIEEELIGAAEPSTFPEYFQNKGYKKKPTIVALNKALDGKKLAPGQERLIQDLHEGYMRSRPDQIAQIEAEQIETVEAAILDKGDTFTKGPDTFIVRGIGKDGTVTLAAEDGSATIVLPDETVEVDQGSLVKAEAAPREALALEPTPAAAPVTPTEEQIGLPIKKPAAELPKTSLRGRAAEGIELIERPKEIAAEKAQVGIEEVIEEKPVEGPERIKLGKSPQPYTVVKELEATPEEAELGERFFEVKNEKTGETSTVAFEEMKPIKKRVVSEKARDKAKANIKEKLKGLKAGVDPTLLKEYAVIGAFHLESGLRKFGEWSKQMISEFGTEIKPLLKKIWKQSKTRVPKKAEVVEARKVIKEKAAPRKAVPEEAPPVKASRVAKLRKEFGAGPLPLKNTEEVYGETSEDMERSANEEAQSLRKSPEVKTYEKEKGKSYKVFVDKVNSTFNKLDPIGSLPEKASYLKKRYLTLGRIAEVNEASKDIYQSFSKATPEQAQTIHEFLTNADIKPTVIEDKDLRESAIKTKKMIVQTGEDLVKRGLLAKQTFLDMKGAYLPRVYLKHLMPGDVFASLSSGKKPSDMGWAKKRKDIPEDVRRLILGEITDPGYLASKGYGVQMRDMAILDWLTEISKNNKWTLDKSLVEWKGQKVTPFWMKNESDRIRKQSKFYLEADRKEALKISTQMADIADEALAEHPGVPDKFKQIPDTPRYGSLRGIVVRKEIYDDIVGASTMHLGDTSIAEQLLGNGGVATKATQLWKWSKVAANPPGQVRNFVSNGILLHLSGVPFHKVPLRVIEAVKDIRKNGKHWQAAKKYGVTESTFGSQELVRIERELLDIEAKRSGPVSLATLKNIGGKIMDLTGDMYQMSESIFKTAKIIDEMKKGKAADDAALEAQKWLFDYSLVTPSMRYLRNAPVGVPFLTFYMKALPRMIEVMLTNPLKFAPYLAIPYAMTAMIAKMTDVEDEDVDKLRKALPKWLEERGNAYIMPAKDEKGRWQAIDIGYFLPWAVWSDMATDAGRGEFSKVFSGTGLFSGPLPDMITAIKTNIDPFTKKEIVNELDSPSKQMASMMGYLYQMSAPTWLTNIGFAGHMYRALSGTVDKYGDPKTNEIQAAMRLVGVNLYPIDPMRTRADNIKWMEFEISKVKRRRTTLLKDKNNTPAERRSIITEYNGMIRRRKTELRKYKQASFVHPRLR
jgi:hypothetical protein